MLGFFRELGADGVPVGFLTEVTAPEPANPDSLCNFETYIYAAIAADGIVGPRSFELRFLGPAEQLIARWTETVELVGDGIVGWNQKIRAQDVPLGTYWAEIRYQDRVLNRAPLSVHWR
jgi:hypothetical protein